MSEEEKSLEGVTAEPELPQAPAEPELPIVTEEELPAADEPELPAVAEEELPAASDEAEPEEETDPLAEASRQWVSLPTSSCNVRIGSHNLEHLGSDLISAFGKPAKAALLFGDEADAELVRDVYFQLTSAGFRVGEAHAPAADAALTPEAATAVFGELDRLHITSDDLVLAIGSADQLALASFVCGAWCGGTTLAAVPLDFEALIVGTVTPKGLSIGSHEGMVQGNNGLKHVFADFSRMDLSDSEGRRLAFAVMVATAVADTEKAFEALFDRRHALVDGDLLALRDQTNESLRSRGRIISSTSVAVRQSLGYGIPFAEALAAVSPEPIPASVLLAEGLRFVGRLAVTEEEFPIDDMLAQDELLSDLGLGSVTGSYDPEELLRAMRASAFLHSNRFMLAVPRSFGRVRLTTVADDVLLGHLGAWCAQHAC